MARDQKGSVILSKYNVKKVEEFNYNHRSVAKCPHVGSAVQGWMSMSGPGCGVCWRHMSVWWHLSARGSTNCVNCLLSAAPGHTCPMQHRAITLYILSSEEPISIDSVACSCANAPWVPNILYYSAKLSATILQYYIRQQITSLAVNQHCIHRKHVLKLWQK